MVDTIDPNQKLTIPEAAAYIQDAAPGFGLDPNAVIAVAMHEGLFPAGWAGPHPDPAPGHPDAFAVGPFQMNSAGALPTWISSQGKSASDTWAWSVNGINAGMQKMSAAGARNLSGLAAVQAIVSKFEISADIPGEIQRAWATYQTLGPTSIPGIVSSPGSQGSATPDGSTGGSSIVTGPGTTSVGGGTTDTQPDIGAIGTVHVSTVNASGVAGQIQIGLQDAFSNMFKEATASFFSPFVLIVGSIIAIIVGAIIWNGDKVKTYAPDVAVAAATA